MVTVGLPWFPKKEELPINFRFLFKRNLDLYLIFCLTLYQKVEAVAKVSKTKHNERFRLITDPSIQDGYRVNRYGLVLGKKGRPLKVFTKKTRKDPFVILPCEPHVQAAHSSLSLFTLIRDYWGIEAAHTFRCYREALILKELQKDE